MYDSSNCAASAWFLNQDLGFFENVSVETVESAQPLTTAITDQLMSDDTVVRVHLPVLRILIIGHGYLLLL